MIKLVQWLSNVLAVAALLATLSPAVHAQLDGSFTVSVNGQTVQVNSDGTFYLANVVAPDAFGPGGPGTRPDFIADDFMRLAGVSTQNGTTLWAFSDPFELVSGRLTIIGNVFVTTVPPLSTQSISVSVDRSVLTVGETTQLSVSAFLTDGSQVDVTPRSGRTTYRSSAPSVLRVNGDGLVSALGRGRAFITVTNEGATAVKQIDVFQKLVTTTFVGFCLAQDGSAVAGAQLWTNYQGSAMSQADGSFSLMVNVPPDRPSQVFAYAVAGGNEFYGKSALLTVTADGYTDAGLLVLKPKLDVHPYDIPEVFHSLTYDLVVDAATADLDGDGDLDLAAASYEGGFGGGERGGVDVVLNHGNGTFDPPIYYQTSFPPMPSRATWGVRAGDLDQDRDVDLLVLDFDNTGSGVARVLRNRGDGAFDLRGAYSIGAGAPDTVVVGDFDNDSDLDFAAHLGVDTSLKIMKNQGDGSFVLSGSYNSGGQTNTVSAGDVDGDGDQDLLAINYRFSNPAESELAVLKNDGAGGFAAPVIYQVGGELVDLALADIDGDGDVDAAIAVPDRVTILKNNGAGVFGNKVEYPGLALVWSIAAVDLDHDGDNDIAVAGAGPDQGSLVILVNRGDGSFSPPEVYPSGADDGNPILVLLAADADRDQDVDLLEVANTGISLQRNHGHATPLHPIQDRPVFVRFPNYAPDMKLKTSQAADLDDDLDLDAVVTVSGDHLLRVLRNDGEGGLAVVQEKVLSGTGSSQRLATADVDLDSDVDCLVTLFTPPQIAVLQNIGDGTFDDPTYYPTGNGLFDVATADLDGDGDADIVDAHNDATLRGVGILRNIGDGTFAAESLAWLAPDRVARIAVGDLDLDGDVDVVASQNLKFALLKNDGQGNFPNVTFVPTTNSSINAFGIGDLNHDLDPEVVVGGGQLVSVHLNDGNGGFGPPADYPVRNSSSPTVTNVFLADLNGDLDTDLLLGVRYGVCALYNEGNALFGPERFFGGFSNCESLMSGDFDLDGFVDGVAAGGDNDSTHTKGLWLLHHAGQ